MADVYFKCSCGKSLAIDENGVGRTIACVDCGKPVTVPAWEFEFICPHCNMTFGAVADIAGDTVQCTACGEKIVIPEMTAPEPEAPRESPADETPEPAVMGAPPEPSPVDEPQPPAEQPAPIKKRRAFPVNGERLAAIFCRLTVIVVLCVLGAEISRRLILHIGRSSAGLAAELQRSQNQPDIASAVAVIEKALADYPLAWHRSQARQLLAEDRLILGDTTNIAAMIARTKADQNVWRAVNLMTIALRKYHRATNRAEAEALIKSIQARQNDTWMLYVALVNASQAETLADGIKMVEDGLAQYPAATNRVEAEALLADLRKQLQDSGERDTQSASQTSETKNAEPLLAAIGNAQGQPDVLFAIQILKEAIAKHPDSKNRAEADKVLAIYQKQLLDETAGQRSALTNFIETASAAALSAGYTFLSPDKAPAGNVRGVTWYDSRLVNRDARLNCALEIKLQERAGQGAGPDKTDVAIHTNAWVRYIPRLILSARGGDIPEGYMAVVEYYVADVNDNSKSAKADVEYITFPPIARGRPLAVDCRGVECKLKAARAGKGPELAKDSDEEWRGIIVSLYSRGRELLLQKCSSPKLVSECVLLK